jgi:hypothetical protein
MRCINGKHATTHATAMATVAAPQLAFDFTIPAMVGPTRNLQECENTYRPNARAKPSESPNS